MLMQKAKLILSFQALSETQQASIVAKIKERKALQAASNSVSGYCLRDRLLCPNTYQWVLTSKNTHKPNRPLMFEQAPVSCFSIL